MVWENPESELTGWHGLVPDEDAAKAAAQADYEARILSALEPDPTGGWCSDMEAARVLLAALAKKTAHSQRDEFSRVGHSINEASWHVHLAGFRSQDEALAFLDAALRAIAEGK